MKRTPFALVLSLCLMFGASHSAAHETGGEASPSESGAPVSSPAEVASALQEEAGLWFANINGLIGGQIMLDSGWKNDGSQTMGAFAWDVDFGRDTWPVSVYIGSETSTSGDIKINYVDAYNISTSKIGARLYFSKTGSTRSYISGGAAFLGIEKDYIRGWDSQTVRTDSTTGLFANAGIFFKMGRYFQMGFDICAVAAGGMEGKANSSYVRGALTLGLGTP